LFIFVYLIIRYIFIILIRVIIINFILLFLMILIFLQYILFFDHFVLLMLTFIVTLHLLFLLIFSFITHKINSCFSIDPIHLKNSYLLNLLDPLFLQYLTASIYHILKVIISFFLCNFLILMFILKISDVALFLSLFIINIFNEVSYFMIKGERFFDLVFKFYYHIL
jgi:hypothetical protein